MPETPLAQVLALIGADTSALVGDLERAVEMSRTAGTRAVVGFAQNFEKIKLSDFAKDFTKLPRQLKETADTGFSLVTEAANRTTGALGRTGGAAQIASRSFQLGDRNIKQLASGLIGNLNPALGGAVSQSLGAAISLKGLGLAFGIGGAAALTFSSVMGSLLERLNSMRESQLQVNRAIERADFGALEGQVAKASEELAKFRQLQDEIAGGGFGGLIARFQAFGQSSEQLETQLAQARSGLEQVFVQFERPLRESKLNIAAAELRKQFNELAIQQTTTLTQANALFAKQAEEINKITAEQKKLATLEAQREITRLAVDGRILEANERRRVLQRELNELDQKNTVELRRNAEARREQTRVFEELAAKQRAFAAEQAANQLEEQKAIVETTTQERKQRADSQLDALRIEQEGLRQTQEVDRAKLDQRRGNLELELEETRRSVGLGVRERLAKEEELSNQLATLASQRTIFETTAASQLRQNEFAINRQRLIDEDQLFQLRRALGEVTLQDEIRRNQEISRSASRTKDERLAAERAVFEGQKRLRDEARSAAQGLLGEARQRLEARGITAVTKEGVEQEIRQIQEERKKLVNDVQLAFETGGVVSLDNLDKSFEAAGKLESFEEMTKKFGSVGNVLSSALQTGQGDVFAAAKSLGMSIAEGIRAGADPQIAALATDLRQRIVQDLGRQLAAEARRL